MSKPIRVAFVALGCAKNLVDSEKMLGQLAEAGCAITADESDAEVVVVNTCGFLEAARTEADQIIRDVVDRKSNGPLKRVVVAGCLVQRDGETLSQRIPGVDALVGVNNRDDIVRAVLGKRKRRRRPTPDLYVSDYHPFVQLDTARLRLTPHHYAYLRISEGCNQKCTFCTIPSIRGAMHCKPPSAILNEARELVQDGAVEIILIGQDTTSYGFGDDSFNGGLAGLLKQLDAIDGIQRVRLMYAYPSSLTDDVLDAIAACRHVCRYIDIPLQHINDRMLRAMGRGIDRPCTEALLQRIRDRVPGVTIRTTLIAGFPGESEAEFQELLDYVQAFRFDALGVFPYSQEPGTPAARLCERIPDQVIAERVDLLMRAQQAVAFSLADERVGSRFDVLVDESSHEGTAVGRHEGQTPDVDGTTIINGCDAPPGSLVPVRCTGRNAYDLVATPTSVSLPTLAI